MDDQNPASGVPKLDPLGSTDVLLAALGPDIAHVAELQVPNRENNGVKTLSPPPLVVTEVIPGGSPTMKRTENAFSSMDNLLAAVGATDTRTARLLNQVVHGTSQHSVESRTGTGPRRIVNKGAEGPPLSDEVQSQPSSQHGSSTHSGRSLLGSTMATHYADYALARGSNGVHRRASGCELEQGNGALDGGEEGSQGRIEDDSKPMTRFECIIEEIFHVRQRGSTINREVGNRRDQIWILLQHLFSHLVLIQ